MKILFYLPAVTPWWFDHIVEPLIRCAAQAAEVHILAPEPWQGTGVGEREQRRCIDLSLVHWHIVGGSDHPSLRTVPADPQALIDFVAGIAPDYVLCRSADFTSTRGFPGQVRFVMEAGVAPFGLPPQWIALDRQPFEHGVMPDLAEADTAMLDRAFAPLWRRVQKRRSSAGARKRVLARAGVTTDHPLLLLPLDYEHGENFFLSQRLGPASNADLVAEIAAQTVDRFTLALTNHPLNDLYVDPSALHATVARLGPNVVLVPSAKNGGVSTQELAPFADGMILYDSKSFALAAFFATPILRRSRFATGAWANAMTDLDGFLDAVATKSAIAPDVDAARRWFAFHLANNAFDPQAPDLTLDALLARVDRPVDPGRWETALAEVGAAHEGAKR